MQEENAAAEEEMRKLRDDVKQKEERILCLSPARSLELDLPLVRGAPGEGGSAGRSGTQGDRKRGPSRFSGRHSMDDGGDDDLGGLVP